MCPSCDVTLRAEVCDQKARGHIMWWEQVRQVEGPSQLCVPVASCDQALVTEGLLFVSEEKLWQQGAEHGPG